MRRDCMSRYLGRGKNILELTGVTGGGKFHSFKVSSSGLINYIIWVGTTDRASSPRHGVTWRRRDAPARDVFIFWVLCGVQRMQGEVEPHARPWGHQEHERRWRSRTVPAGMWRWAINIACSVWWLSLSRGGAPRVVLCTVPRQTLTHLLKNRAHNYCEMPLITKRRS